MAIQLAGARFEYILEDDRKSKKPTVFHIRELNAAKRTKLMSCMLGIVVPADADIESLIQANEHLQGGYLNACQIGIRLATPILDHKGKEVKLGITKVLSGIKDPEHIKELALAVIHANALNKAERKKSETPPEQGRQD